MLNYPDTAPTNLPAFPPWSDALAASEEMAMWAQLGEYTQPEPAVEGIPLDILDAVLGWGPSRTTPVEAFSFENNLSGNWTSGGTEAEGSFGHSVPLLDATATGATSPESYVVTPPFADNTVVFSQESFFTQPDFSLSCTPSPTNASTLPSPQSDGVVDGFLQFPILDAAPSNVIYPPGPPIPQLDAVGAWGPNEIAGAPPSFFMGCDNLAGQVQPNFGQMFDPFLNMPYSAPLDYSQFASHLPMPIGASTSSVTLEAGPSTSLGKRSRQSDEDGSAGPKKRGRLSPTRVPGEATSRKRTRRPPVTRTQTMTNCISKAAGRGAERLGSTTVRGVYNRSLLGLSVPQGSVGLLAQEQPSWIEESVQVEMWRDMGSSAPQQVVVQENAEDEDDLRKLPGNLTGRERSMLLMTQAERERGGVRTIKCKLCPDARLSSWATYQRHCKNCEKHPLELHYCDLCGDYFARGDSRGRHQDTKDEACHQACRNTSKDDAMEKKEKVDRIFNAFNAELTRCLKSGEEIWPMFSDAATRSLTITSKKTPNKGDISYEGTWAARLC